MPPPNGLKHGRTASSVAQASAPNRHDAKEPTPPATLREAIEQNKKLHDQLDTVLDFVEAAMKTIDAPAAVKAIVLSRNRGLEALAASISSRMYAVPSKLCQDDLYPGMTTVDSDMISGALAPYMGEIAFLADIEHPKAVELAYDLLHSLRRSSYGELDLDGGGNGDRPSDQPADELLARLVERRAAAMGELALSDKKAFEAFHGRQPNKLSLAWWVLQRIEDYAKQMVPGLYPDMHFHVTLPPCMFLTYDHATPLATHLVLSKNGVVEDVASLVRDVPVFQDWPWRGEHGEDLVRQCPRLLREGREMWLSDKQTTKVDRGPWAWDGDLDDIQGEAKHLDEYGIEPWFPRAQKALAALHHDPWYPKSQKEPEFEESDEEMTVYVDLKDSDGEGFYSGYSEDSEDSE